MALGDFFSKKEKKKKRTSSKPTEKKATESAVKEEKIGSPVVETEFFDRKSVIKRPWVSEKAYELHENNKYVFLVEGRATKNQIKKEVESRWGVSVESVNVINKKQRRRQWRGRPGRQYTFKKAIVAIKKGDKIDIYPV